MMIPRGWCPDIYTPMQSGDGWLARLKPLQPELTSATLRLIAASAERHGNGVIELTSRANLQIRGLTEASAALFAGEMRDAGLALPDPIAERRRNVLVSPLTSLDPDCAPETLSLAQELAQALPDIEALPAKFFIAVDGSGLLPLGDATADIVLRAYHGTWFASLGGTQSLRSDTPAQTAISLARLLAAHGQRSRPLRERDGETSLFPGPTLPMPTATKRIPIGPITETIFGLGLRFGLFDADHLADLADRYGDGTIRVTPWRAVLLTGVRDPGGLRMNAQKLIRDPADPRRRVIACPGQPSCTSAHADVRAIADTLAPHLAAGATLHLSGCVKGCANPGPADITLVATPTGYDLIRHGRAADAALATGLTLAEAASHIERTAL